jgi:hypothetical protein
MNVISLRFLICCLFVSFIGCDTESSIDTKGSGLGVGSENKHVAADEKTGTVTVIIRYPNGSVDSSDIGIDADDTVADTLRRLKGIPVVIQGSGSMTFVAGIGEFETAGGEGWSYRVNGQWADRSAGVYQVSPGDQIEWTFGNFEPTDQE